jgi:cellulase
MYALSALALSLLGLAHTVSAHGYLKSIEVNGKSYLAWQVGSDDYITPEPTRYARRIQDNGPVADFTTVNITCNQGGNIPSKGAVPVNAGDKVKLIWDQWGSSHSGPVMSMIHQAEQDSNKN